MGDRIDWVYRRNGCSECQQALAFFAEHGLTPKTLVDADKVRFGADQAVRMAREADHVWVAGPEGAEHHDMRSSRPTDEALNRALGGGAGGLRAPTVRHGRVLLIGYDEAAYRQALLSATGATEEGA